MGLIICITACCCGFCAAKKIRKNRKRKRELRRDQENGEDDSDVEQQDIIGNQDGGLQGTNISPGGPKEGQQITIGINTDGPPPLYPGHIPLNGRVEIADEGGGANTHRSSSKKAKYEHLADAPEEPPDKPTDKGEKSSNVTPEENGAGDHGEDMPPVRPEDVRVEVKGETNGSIDEYDDDDDDDASLGGRKHSSKKYKYSPLKLPGARDSQRSRTKSGDSYRSSSSKDTREVTIPISEDVSENSPKTYL